MLLWFIFLLVATGWGQVTHLVFNGQSLQPYAGQTVLFDQTLQGIHRTDKPAFSFQGHPEASPGPHDCAPLFDHFIELIEASKK